MPNFMAALARKAFLKAVKNELGEVDYFFDPGRVTAADIKAYVALSDEFADQLLSVMHDPAGQSTGLRQICH